MRRKRCRRSWNGGHLTSRNPGNLRRQDRCFQFKKCGWAPREFSRCPPHEASKRTGTNMIQTAKAETVRRVVSTRMPTRWGVFQALAFEREIANGAQRVETALALVLRDLTEAAP